MSTNTAPLALPTRVRDTRSLIAWFESREWSLAPVRLLSLPDDELIRELDAPDLELTWANAGDLVPLWIADSRRLPRPADVARACRRFARHTPSGCVIVICVTPSGNAAVATTISPDGDPAQWRGSLDTLDECGTDVWTALAESCDASSSILRVNRELSRRMVGSAFFKDVRAQLEELARAWVGGPKRAEDKRHLALITLCRLMFLAFVQARGWLGEDRTLLSSLLLDPAREDLYRTTLQPLFFDALNTPFARRVHGAFDDVPYLNGGLFDPTPLELAHPNLNVEDSVLRTLYHALFEEYRFVESERDPHRVAIDPRMLGSVFEELMGWEKRKKTGAFYTPPVLAKRLVREALDELLGDDEMRTIRAIDTLRILDPAAGTGAFLLEALHQLVEMRTRLDPTISAAAHARHVLAHNLFGVDLSATAVMLTELRLWLALASLSEQEPNQIEPLPNLRHRIRQGNSLRSIAGLEYDSRSVARPQLVAQHRLVAAELARAHGGRKQRLDTELRSIEREIASELTQSRIDALQAEIDELEAAGSRCDLYGEPLGISLADHRKIRELRGTVSELSTVLESIQLRHTVPAFDARVHFAEVLENGGFDIVVTNPPWLPIARLPKSERAELRSRFGWLRDASGGRFGTQADLSIAFLEESRNLARERGVVAAIVPSKLFRSGYGAALRRDLRQSAALRVVHDLSEDGVAYFSAETFPSLLVFRTGEPDSRAVRIRRGRVPESQVQLHCLSCDESSLDPWPLLETDTMQLLRFVTGAAPRFGDLLKPRLGVKTGCNKAFLRDTPIAEATVPVVRGQGVSGFEANADSHLLFTHDRISGEPELASASRCLEELLPFRDQLLARTDLREGDPWWRLFRARDECLGHRVIWRDIALTLQAVALEPVDEGGPLSLNSTYFAALPNRESALRVSAWLNALPARFVATARADLALGGYRRYQARTVRSVPLPMEVLTGEGHLARALTVVSEELHEAPFDLALWERLDALAARILGLSGSQFAVLRRVALCLELRPESVFEDVINLRRVG